MINYFGSDVRDMAEAMIGITIEKLEADPEHNRLLLQARDGTRYVFTPEDASTQIHVTGVIADVLHEPIENLVAMSSEWLETPLSDRYTWTLLRFYSPSGGELVVRWVGEKDHERSGQVDGKIIPPLGLAPAGELAETTKAVIEQLRKKGP